MWGKKGPLQAKIPCGSQQGKTAQMVLSSLYISAVSKAWPGPGVSQLYRLIQKDAMTDPVPDGPEGSATCCSSAWRCPDGQHQAGFRDGAQPVGSCPTSRRPGRATAADAFAISSHAGFAGMGRARPEPPLARAAAVPLATATATTRTQITPNAADFRTASNRSPTATGS
jgi:hypothetical protein